MRNKAIRKGHGWEGITNDENKCKRYGQKKKIQRRNKRTMAMKKKELHL
jgi:hypothetical protein